MHIDLAGRNVLVTGASRGIGSAIAVRMAEAGARVAVHYRSGEVEARQLSDQLAGSKTFHADLTDMDQVRGLFSAVTDAFGRIDVLVNNAGVAIRVDAADTTHNWERAWETTMNINLKALTLLCRLAIDHFRSSGGGRIINISSRAAFRGDTKDYMD
ncbi:MAG: SDR family oxidoreductase, partial [Rhodothermales bacterium]|nr:SDR family oxidoreductase [Rhodothermales bacterium]